MALQTDDSSLYVEDLPPSLKECHEEILRIAGSIPYDVNGRWSK